MIGKAKIKADELGERMAELIDDVLWSAHEAVSYENWLAAEIQAAIEDSRPSIPHEEVAAEWATVSALIDLLHGRPHEHREPLAPFQPR